MTVLVFTMIFPGCPGPTFSPVSRSCNNKLTCATTTARLKRGFYLKYISRMQPFEFKVENFKPKSLKLVNVCNNLKDFFPDGSYFGSNWLMTSWQVFKEMPSLKGINYFVLVNVRFRFVEKKIKGKENYEGKIRKSTKYVQSNSRFFGWIVTHCHHGQ